MRSYSIRILVWDGTSKAVCNNDPAMANVKQHGVFTRARNKNLAELSMGCKRTFIDPASRFFDALLTRMQCRIVFRTIESGVNLRETCFLLHRPIAPLR